MLSRLAPCLGAAAILAAALASTMPAAAQGRIAATHGDWQIRCELPVGAPEEQCALVQNVEAADRANVSLTVLFLLTADRQARILRVLAPLGVLLPSGLGLSIDENEVGRAGFVRCLPEGCVAEVELDDGLIERFEAGNTATFVIYQTPEEGIGIPISLSGFTSGFAALEDPPAVSAPAAEAEPRAPVETSTRVVGPEVSAEASPAFSIPADDRTALDRLLEDDLFPVVAAAAGGLVLVLLGGFALLLRSRGKRRRRRRAAEAYEEEDEEFEDEDLDDGEDFPEDEEDLARPRRPAAREPARLAAPTPRRQLTHEPRDGDEEVAAAPRPGPRTPVRPVTRPRRSS